MERQRTIVGGDSKRILGWVLALGLVAAPAGAQVIVERLSDGTRLVRNPSPAAPRAVAPVAGPVAPLVGFAGATTPGPDQATLRRLVADAARREGVDPRLVEAVVRAESAWNPAALSHKGAIGLMQLMPATAVELAVDDPWDAAANIAGGVRYLRHLLSRFDRLEHAVAAYNAGPGAVERHGGVPPYRETREYVRRVLAAYDGREPDFAARSGTAPRLVRTVDGRQVLTNVPDGSPPSGQASPRRPTAPATAGSLVLAAR